MLILIPFLSFAKHSERKEDCNGSGVREFRTRRTRRRNKAYLETSNRFCLIVVSSCEEIEWGKKFVLFISGIDFFFFSLSREMKFSIVFLLCNIPIGKRETAFRIK